MCEKWLPVVGYEGLYEVSNLGRVKSLSRTVAHDQHGNKRRLQSRILNPCRSACGYRGVVLYGNGRPSKIWIHALVAEAFLGPRPDSMQVRHGPNGVGDNSVRNLSYGTQQQNSLDMRRDGTHTGKPVVRSDGVEFPSQQVAAEETGCRQCHICMCCLNQRKKAGSFGWQYKYSSDKPTSKRGAKVVIRSDEKEFPSITAAAEEIGCSVSNISACCNGRQKTAGGYGWRFK